MPVYLWRILDVDVENWFSRGVSRNTQLAYKTAVQTFSRFRDLYGLALVWPIPQSHIVMFIAYCFEKSYSPSSITTYMSGLSFSIRLTAGIVFRTCSL